MFWSTDAKILDKVYQEQTKSFCNMIDSSRLKQWMQVHSFIIYITLFSVKARKVCLFWFLLKFSYLCKLNDIGIVRIHQCHLWDEFDLKFISREFYKLKPRSSIYLKSKFVQYLTHFLFKKCTKKVLIVSLTCCLLYLISKWYEYF